MTLAERLKNFQDRGFRAETAAVLVLIEEALHSLFASFTDTFVLFGGATLVLFYGSQRPSGDIDLLVLKDSGAQLDGNLKFHLEDGVVSDRLEDPDFINQRITAVTPNRCGNPCAIYSRSG
jgi:Nucleotidyl transferase AbiEii toxin, Type IV TA system